MSYFFFLLKISRCVEFWFRQLMASWTLRFIFDHPLKQWPTGRKHGKDRNANIRISQERKELFRWNKKHFSKFLKGYHLVKKIKIWWRQRTQALSRKNSKQISITYWQDRQIVKKGTIIWKLLKNAI